MWEAGLSGSATAGRVPTIHWSSMALIKQRQKDLSDGRITPTRGRRLGSPVSGRADVVPLLGLGTVAELPCEFVTLFRDGMEGTESGELQMDRQDAASGYCYRTPDERHAIIFANSEAPWTLGSWTSDAGFLYWGSDRRRERGSLIFCNGTYVNFSGQPIVSSSQRIRRCAIMEGNGAREVC